MEATKKIGCFKIFFETLGKKTKVILRRLQYEIFMVFLILLFD